MAHSKIFLYCVQSGEKFIPRRLGQIFKTPELGTEYRNSTKMLRNVRVINERATLLKNHKILLKLCLRGFTSITLDSLHQQGYWEVESCKLKDPKNDITSRYYKSWGFVVQIKNGGVKITPPWLNNIN